MIRIADTFSGLEAIVRRGVPLRDYTWMKLGGPARYLVEPRSPEELAEAAIRCRENDIPIYVLGLGANLLIADEGVDGAVFRLSADHWRTVQFGPSILTVGAGVDMQKLVLRAVRQGLAGLECMAGIPGTVGGCIKGNAGGKWGDIGARIESVTVMDAHGALDTRTKDDLVFEYRRSNIVAPFILSATVELEEDAPERVMDRVKAVWMYKRTTQPLNTHNAGCIFKNPRGLSAGSLIDQAGLKGFRVGGAQVSQKHANFIIADPGCTAGDVTGLIKAVQEKVYEKHQIVLEKEVQTWP